MSTIPRSVPVLAVPYLREAEIEAASYHLRGQHRLAGGGERLPLDMEGLVWEYLDPKETLSLDLEASLGTDIAGHRIAGKMSVEENGGWIRIDQSVVGKPLYPFTLAHEIGHWVLHRNILKARLCQTSMDLFDDPAPEMLTLQRDLTADGSQRLPPVEWQANRFAVHLLMPADQVRAEFARRFGEGAVVAGRPFADLRDCAEYHATHSRAREWPSLITTFGVSKKAMSIRLEELRLIVVHESRHFMRLL